MKQLLIQIRRVDGFSLVEMLAVMFVVNFALLGIISLSIQAVQTQRFNRNVLIAAQLAQEGIELIRNNRDNQWLLFGVAVLPSNDYAVDYAGSAAVVAGSINDDAAKLYLNGQGYYGHDSSGSSTPFRRLVTLQSGAASTTLVSWVRFSDGVSTKDYKVQTVLYDWR